MAYDLIFAFHPDPYVGPFEDTHLPWRSNGMDLLWHINFNEN